MDTRCRRPSSSACPTGARPCGPPSWRTTASAERRSVV